MKKKLTLISFFEDVPGGCPEELNPFLKCDECGNSFYVIGAADLDWSTNERLFGNSLITMILHCECQEKPVIGSETMFLISFEIGDISITELRTRFVETKPYRTHLERSRVVAQAKVENWDVIRHKISNLLQLPVGFE